jgi:serine/threonine-protein kinase SRK2
MHRKNVAHRDLKLDNTLLDLHDPPHVKICDFGFAKLMGPNATMTTGLGTAVYMAPQQIKKGREGYDGKAAGALLCPPVVVLLHWRAQPLKASECTFRLRGCIL